MKDNTYETEEWEDAVPGQEESEAPEDASEPELSQDEAEEKRREREVVAFIRCYPHVEPQDIPREVWAAVRQGESLVSAYRAYENGALRWANRQLQEKLERTERNRLNRERSAGSQHSAGMGKRLAEWERAWYEE